MSAGAGAAAARPAASPRGMLTVGSGPDGPRTLAGLTVLSVLKALALVALAESVARGVVAVIAGDDVAPWVALGIAAGLVRGAVAWAIRVLAARAAVGTKEATRIALAERMLAPGGRRGASVGDITTLATHGLDDLDKYFATVLPALTGAAVVPIAVGLRVLSVDWVSALVLVLTVPLIPLFLALIGMHTQDRVDAASGALARLSDHLVELARGLPVLVGLGRVEEQTALLARVSDDYRRRTMLTLRTAFLSSLALELISTISVAVVAVFVGLRLIDGSLPLEVGLLALILAPECFGPFRDLGAAFHASQDGVSALERARGILAAAPAAALPRPTAAPGALAARDLTLRYPGRPVPALSHLSFDIRPGTVAAITGPSGSGKSTLLALLAGGADGAADAEVSGALTVVPPERLAWVPQHPHTVGDTVLDELRLYAASGPEGMDAADADAAGDALRALGLAGLAPADPARLSPGELRRLAVARALVRVAAGADVVVLDEPTAHLDDRSAALVRAAIASLRGRCTVVLASHDPDVLALATQRIPVLDGVDPVVDGGGTVRGEASLRVEAAPTEQTGPGGALADRAAGTVPNAQFDPLTETEPRATARELAALLGDVARPAAGRLALALLCGALAALFAVALTTVSGWLIVRASQQPAIMYLLVAIVGVRFFGIGRSVLRYAERLATHDAVFASVTRLRVRLWRALAARGPSARRLLRGGTALDYLVTTADEARDLAPRVILPPAVGVLTGVASLVGVALLHAPAVPPLAVCLVLCLGIAPVLALVADRRASARHQASRSAMTRSFADAAVAAADLRGNAAGPAVLARLREVDRSAAESGRRSAWALGLGNTLVVAACCTTAALMLAVCAPAVASGSLPAEITAVLVLLPIALIDPLLAVVDAVQQAPALSRALTRLARFTPAVEAGAHAGSRSVAGSAARSSASGPVDGLELDALAARWPDADADAFAGVDASARRGEWLVVTGPSGSGKSTLLTVLLGQLAPSAGTYRLGADDTADLAPGVVRRHIAWCPQEGHLFDSSLRANLLLARPREDAPDEAELRHTLVRAGLGPLLAQLPDGLDTRLGSEGVALSGGERQRVAVARTLLTRADVVLLDEPTAHLDRPTADALLADLRSALADVVPVLVTHHAEDIGPADRRLDLGVSTPRRDGALVGAQR